MRKAESIESDPIAALRKGNTTLTFNYGPGRARYKQVKNITYANSTSVTTTLYLGKLFEQSSTGGETKRKHFIYAGGALVSIHTTSNKAADKKRYIFTDHLGSTDVITDASSTVTGRLSFNAFGGQRGLNWRDSNVLAPLQLSAQDTTSRGFTGHEQLDDVGLIHMNGRVYDPTLGRFISADPQVQFVSNLQSYNRYSYVHNNPLSYTDPSGFGLWSKIKNAFSKIRDAVYKWSGQKALVNFIKDNKYAQMAFQIAATYVGGPIGAALASAALTKLNGGSLSDMIRAGMVAGITASFGMDIGMMDPGLAQIAASAALGGASAAIMGGDFKAGFMMAGFTAGFAPGVQKLNSGARFVASTVLSGTASVIGGGKFANGAKSVAFLMAMRSLPSLYKKVVGYGLDMGPGGAAVGKGELQMPVEGANNIGTQNAKLNPDCIACEGGRFSKALNQVPGINAAAGVHDFFQVSLGTGIARDVLNVPGMIPAAAFTYTAALSQPLTHLNTQQIIGIATTYSRNKERDRRHQLPYVVGY